MTDATSPPLEGKAKRKRPSGSETRQKTRVISYRVPEDEALLIEAAADRAGVTVASYARVQTLARSKIPARRVYPVQSGALAQIVGQLGILNNNVNQIARALNSGRDPNEMREIAATLRAVQEMRDAALLALGMRASTSTREALVERAWS